VLHAPSISSSLSWNPNVWWWLQAMKLLIVQSSPASLYFLPLKS
jgi:hypothetical protein